MCDDKRAIIRGIMKGKSCGTPLGSKNPFGITR